MAPPVFCFRCVISVASGAIAIANYDFRSSGTVAKSIEIATAAVEAGLPAQLWAVREDGPFRERVPGNVPVVQVGSSAAMPNRALDLVQKDRKSTRLNSSH